MLKHKILGAKNHVMLGSCINNVVLRYGKMGVIFLVSGSIDLKKYKG